MILGKTSQSNKIQSTMIQLTNTIETNNWRRSDIVKNIIVSMLDLVSPNDDKELLPIYQIYRGMIMSIIETDMDFNGRVGLNIENIKMRIFILMNSNRNHCVTKCVILGLLFYFREMWGWDIDNRGSNDKLINYEQLFNEIKSQIDTNQFVYDWENESDMMDEINTLISSGRIDNRILGEFLTYNEFKLLKHIAPLMGDGVSLCDVKYDPMVSLSRDLTAKRATNKVVTSDNLCDYLYGCRNDDVFSLGKNMTPDQLLKSDYLESMVDVNELIDVVGCDLLLTIQSLVVQLGERHIIDTVEQTVGNLNNVLKKANILKNKMIIVVPVSILAIHLQSLNPKVRDNKTFLNVLRYCHMFISRSKPGVLNIPDLTFTIRTLSNMIGGVTAIDYNSMKTRFGKELVSESFGGETPTVESFGIPDTSTISISNLTEGFKVNRDGSMEILIKEKDVSFVEEYSRVHRLLKLNEKQENYDDVRGNLIYLIILIEQIEKNVVYNKKVPQDSELRADAQRAIRLAKGDISIYMEKLRKAGYNTSLDELYHEAKKNNNGITVDTISTIHGIKAIVKTILL